MTAAAPTAEKKSNLDWALFYASQIWPVAPVYWIENGVCSCGKRDKCASPGKHPIASLVPHGVKQATIVAVTISRWWGQFPQANIAIATGEQSGIDVLDVDKDEGGIEALADLLKTYESLPRTTEVHTGGGGVHFYFRHRQGLTNRTGMLPQGIHVRGDGGYVIAPPSNHISGTSYRFAPDSSPFDFFSHTPDWPDWTIALIESKDTAPTTATATNGAAPIDIIPDGQRNATLTSLAGTMRRRGMGEDELFAALSTTNALRCQPPLAADEVRRIAQSIARYEPQSTMAEIRSLLTDQPLTEEEKETVHERAQRCKGFHLTDMGNAHRICTYYGEDMRYCEAMGGWQVWAGTHWQCSPELAMRYGKATARNILTEAEQEGEEDRAKALFSHAIKTQSLKSLVSMLAVARSEVSITTPQESFDSYDYLFNCANGTFDLQTDIFRPHTRADLLTQLSPISYDHTAQCPQWIDFLNLIFDGNAGLIRFVKQFAGYCLTGSVREQVVFILYGSGSNGKSTLIEAISYILGAYAKTAQTKTFLMDSTDSVRSDLAQLRGARFVSALEIGAGKGMDESLIKGLSGEDRIKARLLYHDFFEFYPKFKIALATNHKPVIRGTDTGIWRRIRLIPFTVAIPEERRDKDFKFKLRKEMPGILNWMLDGCRDWMANGLITPPEVLLATTAYREEQDQVARFLDECCAATPGALITKRSLYSTYETWCNQNNERPVTANMFGRKLTEKGYKSDTQRVGGGDPTKVWWGIECSTLSLTFPAWNGDN